MEDKELFDIWKKNDQQETVVYEKYKEEYTQLVKAQSHDIFKKISRNVWLELICTIASFFVFVGLILKYYGMQNTPFYGFVFVAVLFIIVILSVWLYGKYLKDVKSINEVNIVDSLKKKIAILSNYIKRLNIFYAFSFVVGFVFGLYTSIENKGFHLFRFLRFLGISIPIILVCIWLGKKYIHALYGKHLVSIKKIYEDFLNES